MADQELFDLTYPQTTIDEALALKANSADIRTAVDQDIIDSDQNVIIALKANSADVRITAAQDAIDNAQDAAIAGKAPITMNMRSYFISETGTLYTTDDGSDPQP